MTHQENFVELVAKAANGGSQSLIFDDFLKIAATSLANFDKRNISVWQEREDLFQKTIGRYDADSQKLFVDMLAELGLALHENSPYYRDVLGESFQNLGLNEQKNGQVFTPHHICDLMGDLAVDNVQDEIQKNGYVTIVEPCCGSGAITLGALNSLAEVGINPQTQCRVIAYDLDERCIFMTFIQLCLYHISAVVLRRDAITDKDYCAAWYTFQ